MLFSLFKKQTKSIYPAIDDSKSWKNKPTEAILKKNKIRKDCFEALRNAIGKL
jgi:hypothetical protein